VNVREGKDVELASDARRNEKENFRKTSQEKT